MPFIPYAGDFVNKPISFLIDVFFAMGNMLSLNPREGRTREVYKIPDEQPSQGIAKHFEAVWGHIGKAAAKYEQKKPE